MFSHLESFAELVNKQIYVLKSLNLTGFRAFKSYSVDSLARVNLVVGKNQSGKTSLLEAVDLHVSAGSPSKISESAERRNEIEAVEALTSVYRVPSIASLFYEHKCEPGAWFEIQGSRSTETIVVKLHSLDELDDNALSQMFNEQLPSEFVPTMALTISRGSRKKPELTLPVSEEGLLLYNPHRQSRYRSPALFLSPTSMEPTFMYDAWNSLVREGREHEVVEDMKLLKPNIDSIHLLSGSHNVHGAFVVGLCDARPRYHLGNLGDGFRRLLELRLALANSTHECVLVDEIATGLDRTVVAAMWRLVVEVARKKHIQVFATTHSYDCIYGLASMIRSYAELADEVCIHKVEKSLPRTVSIQGADIPAALESGIDFR